MPDQKWVYLNGNVGFGDHHHQIVEQLAGHGQIDPYAKAQLSNLLLIGQTPAGAAGDVAFGHFEDGYPQIWKSNVDRNAVWDAVMNAGRRMDEHDQGDRLKEMLSHRRPWYVAESGRRVVGQYGQTLNEILLGTDRRSVRHGYMMDDGRVLEHVRIVRPAVTPQEPFMARVRGKTKAAARKALRSLKNEEWDESPS